MSKDIKLSALRLPVDLHTKIVAASQENGRSQHAEMLHRIQASFSEPVLPETHAALAALDKVAQNVMTEVLTRLFTGLEDRLAALIAKKMEAAEMSLITEVRIDGGALAPDAYEDMTELYTGVDYQRFDFPGRPGTRSPTGRLSEAQPELQDLPPISGINTLAATIRPGHCSAFEGSTGLVNFGGFHSGGFCGTPEGELPKILERGEPVIDWSSHKQMAGRGYRWVENTGSRPPELTEKPSTEIEVMTRPQGHTYTARVGDIHPKDWVSSGGGKLPRIIRWHPTAITVNVVNTADTSLADAEKIAGPYGFNGNYDGWMPKGIGLPLGPDAMVDVLYEDGGRLYHKRMGEIDWSNIRSPSRNVTHWRLAK